MPAGRGVHVLFVLEEMYISFFHIAYMTLTLIVFD